MKDSERSFMEAMAEASSRGQSFRQLVDRGARAKLGEVPGEIFLRSLSKAARLDPRYFVPETSRLFGNGASAIFEAVIAESERDDSPQSGSAYEAVVQELVSSVQGPDRANSQSQGRAARSFGSLLHAFRVKDEEGNYPEPLN
jgi:hypothetical protein